MESDPQRTFRRTIPKRWPLFIVLAVAGFVANYLHSLVFRRVLVAIAIRSEILAELYGRVVGGALLTFILACLGGLVSCYYDSLRQRRIHTALTEFGLAVRTIIAGIIALAAMWAAIWITFSGLDRT